MRRCLLRACCSRLCRRMHATRHATWACNPRPHASRKHPCGTTETPHCRPNPTRPGTTVSVADPGLADDAGYSIAWGCCGHVFHLDCISRWLKTRSVCPLCNREWEFAKIEKIATYGNLD